MTEPIPAARAPRPGEWPPGRAHVMVLVAATLAGVYACYRLVVPFVPALAWALTFAVLVAPVHRWNESRFGHRNLAAAVSVIVLAVIVVVPAILVAGRLITEAAYAAVSISAVIESGEWRRAIERYPGVVPLLEWIGQRVNLTDVSGAAAAWLTNSSASFVRVSMEQAAAFLLTFYFLFYLLRDRRHALAALQRLSPLSQDEMVLVGSRIVDTIYATVYGTIVCAVVQGALGGVMFWWLGLPAPVVWGVIMGLLAVVPVFGAWIVWMPAAAFLALGGRWGHAALLTIWGSIVIGLIDNFIYPVLVGNRLRLHTVPAFVAIVGGLIVFGVSGVILGPLVLTVTMALLHIWRERTMEPGRA